MLTAKKEDLPLKNIFNIWWPLALSWLIMSIETPVMSAVIARLPDPRLNLAAYGGVVVPVRMLIVAPLVMLLSASNTLCKDWATYLKIRRFMMITGFSVTLLYFLVAFTPLYYVIVKHVLGVPEELYALGRIGLMISTPLAWGVGYRRFQQGVLIRFGHPDTVFKGTILRLSGNAVVLLAGYLLGSIAGVAVGTAALITGILLEAFYAGIRVRPVINAQLRTAPPAAPLSWKAFAAFYLPLVFTSFLTMIWQPVNSAALSRMPLSIDSLATMPVVTGLAFMFRSFGMAFNEVVISQLGQPGGVNSLKRFGNLIFIGTTLLFLLIIATPLAGFWFEKISALSPSLADLARRAVWLSLPIPALSTLRSWYQGTLLFARKTRGISESILVSLLTLLLVYAAGIVLGSVKGVYVGVTAYVLANSLQALWLWKSSHPVLNDLQKKQT